MVLQLGQELAASTAAGAARDHARRAAEASAAAVAVVQHQPKPWIVSCRDCDDPEEADVCPRCDLPRCQPCGNQGLCFKSPEAQSGRQRLQERQARRVALWDTLVDNALSDSASHVIALCLEAVFDNRNRAAL